MNKLLLDESPILVLPSLAKKVGLNEAIFLQQLHYWLKDSSHLNDGCAWIYNTYEDWQEQFPFWSVSTIRRIITKLENANLLVIGNFNKLKIDKTKWYRINYEVLESMSRPSVQNEQSECSTWTDGCVQNEQTITIDYTKTTTKREEEEEASSTFENPFRFFEENGFGTIGGYMSQKIGSWCDDLSNELVTEAMKIAVERGAKTWSYVEKILIDWADKKIKTVHQANAVMMEFREKKAKQQVKNGKGFVRTEKLPEWFDEEQPVQIKQPTDPETARKKAELDETLRKLRESRGES